MEIISTDIPDVKIIKPDVFNDHRGYFLESYNRNKMLDLGIEEEFIQDNESYSKYGVIRGLHYQRSPCAQTKFIRAVKGELLDVAVDLRRNSPFFGKHVSVILNDKNKYQLYIPKGFAHGFIVLSIEAVILYKVDSLYSREHDTGLSCFDSFLNIDWKLDKEDMVISDKDRLLPGFEEIEYFDM